MMNYSESYSSSDPGPLQSENIFAAIPRKLIEEPISEDSCEDGIEIVRETPEQTQQHGKAPPLRLSESDDEVEKRLKTTFDYSSDPIENTLETADIKIPGDKTPSDNKFDYLSYSEPGEIPGSPQSENDQMIAVGDGSDDQLVDQKFGKLLRIYSKGDIILWDEDFPELPERCTEGTQPVINKLRSEFSTTRLLARLRMKK